MNAFVVAVLFGLMEAMRSFGGTSVATSVGTSMALGYLLLTGHFVGRIFAALRLPRLTGYLLTGLVVGPKAFGVITARMVDDLQLVNGMAIALIALTAGLELELEKMKPLFRTIRWITFTGVIGTAAALAVTVLGLRTSLPFLAELHPRGAIAVAIVLGVVMVAQSPAVVVALKNELQADGPVSRTVLGVVVIADLVVIVLFTLSSSFAKAILGSGVDTWATLGALGWELVGSLVVGAVLGALLALYVQKVRDGAPLFLLTLVFVIAEVGQRLHFDPLLVALGAGIVIRNATESADQVSRHIGLASAPVYVLFFAVAGMALDLDALSTVALPALALVAVRAAGLLLGTRLGASIAGAEPEVSRLAGFGLLPQAGLAIALSQLFTRTFPEFGASVGALTLSVVAINEVLAPILYRLALVRSGEVGKWRERTPAAVASSPAR